MSASTVDQIATGLRPAPVDLALPKIKLSSHQDMSALLSRLGMAVAFSPVADLREISPQAGPIHFVEHAATLRVDEDGTEGAAATAVGVGTSAEAPPHTCCGSSSTGRTSCRSATAGRARPSSLPAWPIPLK